MTWSSTRCTCAMVVVVSTLVMLGNALTNVLSKLCAFGWPGTCAATSGARKALMKDTGTSVTSATGYITKKLTRIEPQSTLRKLVILALLTWPPMSKLSASPNFKPSVLAMPSSTLIAPFSSSVHLPAMVWLCAGCLAALDKLNSRSTRRLARSSVKSSGVMDLLLTATKRPRIIGYQSNFLTPASTRAFLNASPCSGCTLITKRFGASGGVALRQLSTKSVRSSTSSMRASKPTANALVCTTA